MLSTSINIDPLFSIVVLSYNNCNLLLDMLTSIFAQTYPCIQLIISDDASLDFDRDAVQSFCDQNKPADMDVVVFAGKENIGTVANAERARAACSGKYIWMLAADDMIADKEAVSRFVAAFDTADPNTLALCAQVALYDESLTNLCGQFLSAPQTQLLFEGDVKAQFKAFSRECWVPAVGTCYRAEAFSVIGKLSNLYRLVEDWPAYLRLVCSGHPLRGLQQIAVHHRHGGVSHGATRTTTTVQRQYSRDLLMVYQQEIRPNLDLLPIGARLRARFRAVLRWGHHRFGFVTTLVDLLRNR